MNSRKDERKTDSIPFERLEEGLELIQRNVKSLIDSAQVLIDNRKFYHSAVFSIFAIEELAKAHVLEHAKTEKRDLAFKEWNEITLSKAHRKKWKVFVAKQPIDPKFLEAHAPAKDNVNFKNSINFKDVVGDLIGSYFLDLKNHVLYVDWEKRLHKWFWLPGSYAPHFRNIQEESANLLRTATKEFEDCFHCSTERM